MLTLDLARLLESKEILKPMQFMMKIGFTRHTAHRLLNNQVDSISYRHMEILCLALNCTPNDLLSWIPSDNDPSEKIPLLKLTGRTRKGSFIGKLKSLPEDKLDQLREFVNKLAND